MRYARAYMQTFFREVRVAAHSLRLDAFTRLQFITSVPPHHASAGARLQFMAMRFARTSFLGGGALA